MSDFLGLAAVLYLLLGTTLCTLGPGGKAIAKEIKRARGTPLSNAAKESKAPSELKLLVFRLVLTAGFTLLWPIFIYGMFKERRLAAAVEQELREKSKGLWFSYMGGSGTIACNDCGHSEEVTSFIHGIDSSVSGFQCQACGQLHSVKAGGPQQANQYERELVCECGGQLDRDKVLFCPSCKSHALSYTMQFIT